MNQSSIIVNKLTAKWQGQTVLDDISFSLPTNGNLLITGASGSGKTMLAKALEGKIFHGGEIKFYKNEKPVAPSTLFIEQHYHFKNLSNVSNFYYQQRFNSFDADDAPTVQEELLKVTHTIKEHDTAEQIRKRLIQFDLLHRSNSPLLHLSSGEHKRFQLVKALLQTPDFIIFDEPFIGLDIQTRSVLKKAITELADKKTTVILICDPADAPECTSHIAELEKGRLKQFYSKANYQNHTSIKEEKDFTIDLPYQEVSEKFSSIVEFKNVSVEYGDKQILKNINWRVNQGEKWLIKGRNGAGKSTLLSLITGDNPQAYANDIYLFGKKRGAGESIWDIKKNIGYVSPELQWYFDIGISCFDAVASGFFDTIGLFRKLNSKQEKQVSEWLYYFELTACSDKLLSNLPASKQRLVLLARAMVKNPPVLILDEPCQGLDAHQKDHFLQLTEAICANTDRTLIYVTHYQEDVPACVDKILELNEGCGSIHYFQKTFHTQTLA